MAGTSDLWSLLSNELHVLPCREYESIPLLLEFGMKQLPFSCTVSTLAHCRFIFQALHYLSYLSLDWLFCSLSLEYLVYEQKDIIITFTFDSLWLLPNSHPAYCHMMVNVFQIYQPWRFPVIHLSFICDPRHRNTAWMVNPISPYKISSCWFWVKTETSCHFALSLLRDLQFESHTILINYLLLFVDVTWDNLQSNFQTSCSGKAGYLA